MIRTASGYTNLLITQNAQNRDNIPFHVLCSIVFSNTHRPIAHHSAGRTEPQPTFRSPMIRMSWLPITCWMCCTAPSSACSSRMAGRDVCIPVQMKLPTAEMRAQQSSQRQTLRFASRVSTAKQPATIQH